LGYRTQLSITQPASRNCLKGRPKFLNRAALAMLEIP
jgi:hypothetical protein